jgi:hypothetical protein
MPNNMNEFKNLFFELLLTNCLHSRPENYANIHASVKNIFAILLAASTMPQEFSDKVAIEALMEARKKNLSPRDMLMLFFPSLPLFESRIEKNIRFLGDILVDYAKKFALLVEFSKRFS